MPVQKKSLISQRAAVTKAIVASPERDFASASVTPKVAPKVAPKAAPKVTAKAAPKIGAKLAAKVGAKMTAKVRF